MTENMANLQDNIHANVQRQIKERVGSPAWLQTAVEFDRGLRLTQEQYEKGMEIFKLCGIPNREENRINFTYLLVNLLKVKDKAPIMVSLLPSDWKRTRYDKISSGMPKLIITLYEHGFLEIRKGYKMQGKADSRFSRIWATEKLLQYCPEFHTGVILDPREVVILRDKKGKLKDYKDTAKTIRIRSILRKANNINRRADIRFMEYKIGVVLYAIFKEKFTLYGRLHTRGYRHYQGFSEDERAIITINGEPIIELDFSGLHPHLLYAKEGIQFFGDPYGIVDKRPEARPFLKQILLCMLNSKDELKAEAAANFWLYKNHDEREKLKEIGITRARPIMEAFKEVHKPIAHHFANGKLTGLRIMNLDAMIALDIVKHFVKQQIPILAIHDSFLVQERHKDELRQVMLSVYKRHTGGFRCPIK